MVHEEHDPHGARRAPPEQPSELPTRPVEALADAWLSRTRGSAPDLTTALAQIDRFSLFTGLSDGERAELRKGARVRSFAPNSEIDTPNTRILVNLHGDAEILQYDAADHPFSHGMVSPGHPLGELSQLVPGRSEDEKVTVLARTQLHGLELDAQTFFTFVFGHAGRARAFSEILAARIATNNTFVKTAVDIAIDPDDTIPKTLRERVIDLIGKGVGSVRYLVGYTVGVGVWIGMNSLNSVLAIDPYPFMFMNFVVSLWSGYTASFVMLSQNRIAAIERQANKVLRLLVNELVKKADKQGQELAAMRREVREVRAAVSDLRADRQAENPQPPTEPGAS